MPDPLSDADLKPDPYGAAVRCLDCGESYATPAWIEAVIPNELWNEQVCPDDGILCIKCIAQRCHNLGLYDVPTKLTAGPLTTYALEDQLASQRIAAQIIEAHKQEVARLSAALFARDTEWREAFAPGNADTTLGEMCATAEAAAKFQKARDWVHRDAVRWYVKKIERLKRERKKLRKKLKKLGASPRPRPH